jgi:hypothetical protein
LIGYRVDEWEITDEGGDVVDPARERINFDGDYTFTAVRWELLEVSLVSVPADPNATIRSAPPRASRAGNETNARASRERMRIRARMLARHQAFVFDRLCESVVAMRHA